MYFSDKEVLIMNKKLFVGISLVTAVSAGFWACGEGTINEMTEMDNVISMQYPLDPATGGASPELQNLRDNAKNTCKDDMGCYTQYQGYLEGTEPVEVPESSSSEENPGPNTNPTMSSSSRGDFNIVTKPSSSSMTIIENPDPTSSADVEITVPVTGLGSCAPSTATISKGGTTKWKFNVNMSNETYRPADFAKAVYEWTFEGGSPATGTGATTGDIAYSASGAAGASVKVTMGDGASETITCSKVQVNGDPITGCKCAPVGVTGSVDYTTTPDVTWSASGCTSAADIISYTWEGVEGAEPSFTKTFDAETKSYAPKLKVGNNDNTVIDVQCEAVKVTEGAEYTIKDGTDAGKITLPGAGTYNVVIGFACQNKTFFCNGVGAPVGGSVNGTPMAESWYTTASLSAEDCSGNATVSVKVTGAATCGAQ